MIEAQIREEEERRIQEQVGGVFVLILNKTIFGNEVPYTV